MKVTFTCGHEENIRVTSKAHKEEVLLFAAEHKCGECTKLDVAAQPWKETLKLPELIGSEKQISWANDIRSKVVEHRDAVLSILEQRSFREENAHMAKYIANTLDKFIESETSASAWIEIFKAVTSPYSKHPLENNIIGGMAQFPEKFGFDIRDTNFLHEAVKYAK